MANENRRTKIALFLVTLMVLTPLVSGASITDFSSGSDEVDIILNDASTYSDTVDGAVDLPHDESITSASMALSSDPAIHGAHTRIDLETMPRVWNPNYNGQKTSFSKAEEFQFEDGSTATPVSLKAEGILTDFESDPAGFMDGTTPPLQSGAPWSHGSLFGGAVLPANCASGSDCWGTGLYDLDYTDDNGMASFKEVLLSPTLDLSSGTAIKDPSVYFDSFHQLMTLATSSTTNPSYKYPDCAYVEIRTSPTPAFDPSATWSYIDIDIQNSTGLSFGSGYYQVGNQGATSKIDGRCNGVAFNDYALGGTSISAFNPSGWANVKIDLSDYGGNYIELRFVLEYNDVNAGNGYNIYNTTHMPGWYIDNFRFGSTLPQSGWMGVRTILPNVQGGENHPNGYGILTIESETTTTAVLSLDVLDSLTGQVVIDNDGNAMSGLVGQIHELWGING